MDVPIFLFGFDYYYYYYYYYYDIYYITIIFDCGFKML
jgi:hypothetical protein